MEHRAVPSGRRRSRTVGALVCLALAAGLSGGCAVRLETPLPAEPVPDALEVVRRTAVSDSLHVAESAENAAGTVRRAQVRRELERIARAARAQAERLGGVYESGVSAAGTAEPEPTPSEEATTARDVLVALGDAAARSRAAADMTEDGPLARLLASVGTSWTVSAVRLAELTPGPDPSRVDPVVPEPRQDEGPGDEESPASPSPAGGAEAETEDDTLVSTTAPDSTDEPVPPQGLTADELSALVASEDAIGFALQLRAARAGTDVRDSLLVRSRAHRERAQAWAVLARTDGTAQDPRRVAYAVPRAADVPDVALARTLENRLAVDYASLVGTSAAGTRAVLVDLLVDAALAREDWGARPSAFPGLPEQRTRAGGGS